MKEKSVALVLMSAWFGSAIKSILSRAYPDGRGFFQGGPAPSTRHEENPISVR